MNSRQIYRTDPLLGMKRRGSLLTLSLLAAFLAVSCAPAAPTEIAPPEVLQPEATSTVSAAPAVETAVPQIEATVPAVLPVATSRGPNLEATDPATVSLASGDLQLVEFFRFT